jgi:zinc/manganese transport system substrate-binding protein
MKFKALIRILNLSAIAAVSLFLASAPPAEAAGKIRIVSAINDLGSIASSVGGDLVEVVSICRPNADPHHVEVLPSYMVRVSRARLYLKVGLGLDQWSDLIVEGSHSSNVTVVDCSRGVPVLEKPTGKVDASMGDVHPDGNPHYWLDPSNGAIVAGTIADALSRVDPAHADDYRKRALEFGKTAQDMAARGKALQLPVKSIVTYHRSWTYFANALGLNVEAEIEPIPGIPPTGKHLDQVVTIIKQQKPLLVLQEPYFSLDAGRFLSRQTGVRVAVVSPSCKDVTPGSYLAHFEELYLQLQGGAAAGSNGFRLR